MKKSFILFCVGYFVAAALSPVQAGSSPPQEAPRADQVALPPAGLHTLFAPGSPQQVIPANFWKRCGAIVEELLSTNLLLSILKKIVKGESDASDASDASGNGDAFYFACIELGFSFVWKFLLGLEVRDQSGEAASWLQQGVRALLRNPYVFLMGARGWPELVASVLFLGNILPLFVLYPRRGLVDWVAGTVVAERPMQSAPGRQGRRPVQDSRHKGEMGGAPYPLVPLWRHVLFEGVQLVFGFCVGSALCVIMGLKLPTEEDKGDAVWVYIIIDALLYAIEVSGLCYGWFGHAIVDASGQEAPLEKIVLRSCFRMPVIFSLMRYGLQCKLINELMICFDERNQSLGDKVTGTFVVLKEGAPCSPSSRCFSADP